MADSTDAPTKLAQTDTGNADGDSGDAPETTGHRRHLLAGIVSGLVAAVVAIGFAELIAGLARSTRSPLLDVGDRVIDAVPPAVKTLAIDLFGTNDKIALLVGIGVFLAVFAAVVGVLALNDHELAGILGVSVFGVIGAASVLLAREPRPIVALLPSLLGAAAGVGALLLLIRAHRTMQDPKSGDAAGLGADTAATSSDESAPAGLFHGRRAFMATAVALAAAGATAGAVGRSLGARFSAAASRAAVVLPRALRPLPAPPAGIEADASGITPFFTPNDDFYRIDTALTVPQVPLDSWRLSVDGMVAEPFELDYEQLLAEELTEADITLTCVSNEVGGSLLGTAHWLGVRLDDIVERAGPSTDADQVVGRSVDGYTCGFPLSALDGRDALVAIAMNDEPLPLRHGFPARLIVPGLYGYVSATKWLTDIEITRFDRFDQYWVPRGWDAEAPIKTSSRIDTPGGLERLPVGPVTVGGVAWAQPLGIESVEVSIDDGPWMPANLAEALNDVTWRQWTFDWDATAGRHTLTVRAIDGNGAIQESQRSEPMPNGATGLHQIVVLVGE